MKSIALICGVLCLLLSASCGAVEVSIADNEAFLAKVAAEEGVTQTESGLLYKVLVEGTGEQPHVSSVVQVHYEGTFIDGTVFDSSYTRGKPIKFPLRGVIPGWTEGVQLMTIGSTYEFTIPSDLAYGVRGAGRAVPPNAVLVFKIELLGVEQQP